MDIMDSTDTPTGGLDGSTASRGALPLSVDERDSFSSSADDSGTSGGTRATSTIPGESYSSSSSAFDRLDAVTGGNRIDENSPNALPTSTDDIMMPTQEFSTHPSVLGNDLEGTLPRTTEAHPTTATASDKASEMASDVKGKASSMMSSLSSTLHHAGEKASEMASDAKQKASEEYGHLKADVSSHMSHSHTSTSTTPARISSDPEPTDTHPDASSMRDSHLHSNLSSLPTHANEVRAPTPATSHVSDAQARGIAAAANAEPKDPSASTSGVMGTLAGLHQKLEDGVEAVKDKVDGWAERNLRSSPKDGEHLSEAHVKDIPTLVDTSNERNTEYVRAKMHPSSERAGANALTGQDAVDAMKDNSL